MADDGPAVANNKQYSPKEVEVIHRNADTDGRREALHHTLGPSPTQASPGDHKHDGSSSAKLLTGVTIAGSRTDGTAVLSIIQALVKLGAQNSTTT